MSSPCGGKKKGSRLTHCLQTVSDYREANAFLSLSHTFHHFVSYKGTIRIVMHQFLWNIDRSIDGSMKTRECSMNYILNFYVYYFKSFEFLIILTNLRFNCVKFFFLIKFCRKQILKNLKISFSIYFFVTNTPNCKF